MPSRPGVFRPIFAAAILLIAVSATAALAVDFAAALRIYEGYQVTVYNPVNSNPSRMELQEVGVDYIVLSDSEEHHGVEIYIHFSAIRDVRIQRTGDVLTDVVIRVR